MRISIIVATAQGGVIGKENGIPWYMPADLAYFRKLTSGHPIIMGRKTHESIGRILPDRLNIIISRDTDYKAEGAQVVHSLEQAINIAKSTNDEEIFVIGGDSIYKMALPFVNRIYITDVDAAIEGDRFFKFNRDDWIEVSKESHQPDEKNKFPYEFVVLDRR